MFHLLLYINQELLHEALRYMKQNGYNDNHPWVQKFDIENTIHTAQRLAEQGKHEDSLALFDDLLRKKKKLAAIMPNLVEQGVVAPNSLLTGDFASDDGDSLSLAVIEPVESITLTNTSLQLGQEMMLISEGKIEGLINKARRLIYDGLYSAAEDLLLQCSELPPQLMSDDHIYLSDVKLLQGKCRFELADFDSANNYYVEALQGKIDLFGPDSVKLVEVMLWIAELREMLASYDEAETFYSQVGSLLLQLSCTLCIVGKHIKSCNRCYRWFKRQ